jgi:hypothetical protein
LNWAFVQNNRIYGIGNLEIVENEYLIHQE